MPPSAAMDGHNLIIPREKVSGRAKAQNGYSWTYGYDIELKGGLLLIGVPINLVAVGGVSGFELERVKSGWEACIEQVWSRQFELKTPSGCLYPIVIDANFKGPRFHHHVVVRRGSGSTNVLNWRLSNPPELVAHEFGHMLGVFDEYRTGGIAPKNPEIDPKSIMTLNPTPKCRTCARHYKKFRDWFVERTGLRNVTMRPISAPREALQSNSRNALK